MESKQQLWRRIQQEWPDLGDFLKELQQAGMKAENVDVKEWPETRQRVHEEDNG